MSYDVYFSNDKGENYNMSQAVRDMIAKIDACLKGEEE